VNLELCSGRYSSIQGNYSQECKQIKRDRFVTGHKNRIETSSAHWKTP
jgi:hypothetical protein